MAVVIAQKTVARLQCRLRPGPRKLKQTLPVFVAFGAGGRKYRLLGVLPELIRFRHGARSVPRHPNIGMRSLAVAV